MIEFLSGKLIEKVPTHVVLDCNGVGYLIHISLNTFEQLPNEEYCKLLIHYSVSVDVRSGASNHLLFGFNKPSERELFRLLISISGISSTTARMILSSLSSDDIKSAVVLDNVDAFKSIKGIGPKMAVKIVHELKDKIDKIESGGQISISLGNTSQNEALTALIALGFDRSKSKKVVAKVVGEHGSGLTVEELIKTALKQL